MKILYYYIIYLRQIKDPETVEIHLCPFNTKAKAEAYKLKADKEFADRLVFSKIKKVDLAKYEGGFWL